LLSGRDPSTFLSIRSANFAAADSNSQIASTDLATFTDSQIASSLLVFYGSFVHQQQTMTADSLREIKFSPKASNARGYMSAGTPAGLPFVRHQQTLAKEKFFRH
jgi:hypothetical protein